MITVSLGGLREFWGREGAEKEEDEWREKQEVLHKKLKKSRSVRAKSCWKGHQPDPWDVGGLVLLLRS